MVDDTPDRRLAAVARGQSGCFTIDDALAAGFTAAGIRSRLRRGTWRVVVRGVYCAGTTRPSAEVAAVAALLAAGSDAAFSHLTAARLLGIDVRHRDDRAWLTVPFASSARTRPGVCVTRTRHPVEAIRAHGYPVLPVARTVVDLAQLLDEERLTGVLYDAVRRKVVGVDGVLAEAEAIGGGRAGLMLLRRVSRRFDPAFDAMVEARVGTALSEEGIVMQPQYELWDGPFLVARFDFADESLRLALEVDGFATHSSRDQQAHDRARDRHARRLGWTTIRFDATDALRRLDMVVADVLAVRDRLRRERRRAG